MISKFFTALVLLSALLAAGIASAGTLDTIYMTDAGGSHTQKTTYTLNETPWLYLNLPGSGWHLTTSSWLDPAGMQYDTFYSGADNELWVSLTNWGSIKKLGSWDVTANYQFFSTIDTGSGHTSFTVTPEPVSTVLFVLGGGVLALRQGLRRGRQT